MHTEPAEKPNKTMIKITRIGPNEIDALRAISIWTFEETFAAENTAQDLAKYVEQAFGKEKLLAEIKDPGSFFYFAETDGRTIGYLKVNAGGAQTEIQDARSVEIERIYVLQEFHGMKAGQVLFEQAMQLARELDAEYVWLGVWERNPRAIAFYRKNGFEAFDKHVFKLGDDEQTDIMMRRSLKDQ